MEIERTSVIVRSERDGVGGEHTVKVDFFYISHCDVVSEVSDCIDKIVVLFSLLGGGLVREPG